MPTTVQTEPRQTRHTSRQASISREGGREGGRRRVAFCVGWKRNSSQNPVVLAARLSQLG